MSNPSWVISLWLTSFPLLPHSTGMPKAAGKSLGIRLNFSSPGKFFLGHTECGGGTSHCPRSESATFFFFSAPPYGGPGAAASIKAALSKPAPSALLPLHIQGTATLPGTMDQAPPLRLWILPLLLVGSASSLASVSAQGIGPGFHVSFFCWPLGTCFLPRLSPGPYYRQGEVTP